MIDKLASIDLGKLLKPYIDVGCGKAIFDKSINPKKRYFLEKRWGEDKNILSVIMTNPSTADSLGNDETVEFLIEYAKHHNYNALYVVNIIPIINSSTKKLKSIYSESIISQIVKEKTALESIKYALKNSNSIILAWGEFGQKYFKYIIEDDEIKNLFLEKANLCEVFDFGKNDKFPKHPRPNNPYRYDFTVNTVLKSAGIQLESWISN
ncbi:DUF1643 domain-containing protein [Bacillus mobilis]|uniref:DUF1643 domain-containing protein n=1 Tax=Bacillus mobilis TaxID=2026190 RepID=UPI0036297522